MKWLMRKVCGLFGHRWIYLAGGAQRFCRRCHHGQMMNPIGAWLDWKSK